MAIAFKKSATAPKPAPSTPGKSGAGFNFLKTGAAAQAAVKAEEAKAQAYKEQHGRLWRFFMKEGESRTLTFLDGTLNEDGLLDVPMVFEHTVMHAGKWENFVCTEEHEPCPLCAEGDRHTLVGLFTIIDHTEHTIQKGPNQGKMVKNQRRLFVAKRTTLKQLQKLSEKRGGMAGCTFEVSRTGDKSPAVGDMFDFQQQNTADELHEYFGNDDEGNPIAVPADYAHEIIYRTADQLIELGVGKSVTAISSGKTPGNGVNKANLAAKL